MRLPQRIVDRAAERRRQEQELQKLRDERIKAISSVMIKSTIPTTVLHLKPKEEVIEQQKQRSRHG